MKIRKLEEALRTVKSKKNEDVKYFDEAVETYMSMAKKQAGGNLSHLRFKILKSLYQAASGSDDTGRRAKFIAACEANNKTEKEA